MNVFSEGTASIMGDMIRLIRSLVHIYFIQVSTFFPPLISSYMEADEMQKQQYCLGSTIVGFLL